MKIADKREQAKQRLQQLVADGLDSGPAKPMFNSDWGDMDQVAILDQPMQTALRAQAARQGCTVVFLIENTSGMHIHHRLSDSSDDGSHAGSALTQ